jgi:site-specific recombinase XerD
LRPEPVYGNRVLLNAWGYPITENTIKMFIERAAKWADIPRLHVHLLRHTFATRFIMEGGDISQLQMLMGHEQIETTMRYVKRGALQQIVLNRAISPMDAMQLSNRTNFRRGKKTK